MRWGEPGSGAFGPSLLPTDPAAAADQTVPSGAFTLGSSWITVGDGELANDASGTRFPFLAVSYPVRSLGVLTVTHGSVLDQRWQARIERLLPLYESTGRVTDTFLSDGGVAALRVGFAGRIGSNLSLGGALGTLTGSTTRRLSRTYDSLDVAVLVPPFQTEGSWRYSGLTATLGASVELADVVRVSASVDASGDLEAKPVGLTTGSGRSYDIPLTLRLGVSGLLAPGLVLGVGVTRADWSSVEGVSEEGSGRAVTAIGGGLEFTQASLLGRTTPLRLGYRRSALPFSAEGGSARETVFTGGLGLNLVEGEDLSLARLDLGLERGTREAGSLSERFWRFSLSVQVAGS